MVERYEGEGLSRGTLGRLVPFAALWATAVLSLAAPGIAAGACPNEALRSELGFGALQDCRGYELVTPPFKEGSVALSAPIGESLFVARSEDGSSLIVQSPGAFAGTENDQNGPGIGAVYQLTRTEPEGWKATPLVPPAAAFSSYAYLDASPDLTASLWRLRAAAEPKEEGEGKFYLREPGGGFTLIGPASPSPPENQSTAYVGASRDLSHVLFQQSPETGLWPGDSTVLFDSLYEYAGTHNSEPRLVGVKNQKALTSIHEAELVSSCGTQAGSQDSKDTYNAISADGSTVFFTARSLPEVCPTPSADELYARIGGARTVAISEPSSEACSACDTEHPMAALFRGASEDGSKVFFMTEQELLAGAKGMNLYEYNFAAARGEKVSLVSRGASEASVQGVARVSEDGSRVYFVARAVLTAEPNVDRAVAQAEEDNLYVFTRNATHPDGALAFVGTLSPEDEQVWQEKDHRPVQATPDGRFLIFLSSADLTVDDTSTARQLFEYDAATGALVRISIGQAGFNDDGNTDAPELGAAINPQLFERQEGRFNNSHPDGAAALSVSDDGSYVFFMSANNLTPQATPGANNVYEYHAGGVGLISDGHDASGSLLEGPSTRLLGTDRSATNVFFSSADQLVGQDGDTQRDIYDARIGGGFPRPLLGKGCIGEGCRGSLAAAPSLPTAGSVLTPGGENLAPPIFKPRPKPLTNAQKLAKALKACSKKPKKRRHGCKAQARKRYGPKHKAPKSARRAN